MAPVDRRLKVSVTGAPMTSLLDRAALPLLVLPDLVDFSRFLLSPRASHPPCCTSPCFAGFSSSQAFHAAPLRPSVPPAPSPPAPADCVGPVRALPVSPLLRFRHMPPDRGVGDGGYARYSPAVSSVRETSRTTWRAIKSAKDVGARARPFWAAARRSPRARHDRTEVALCVVVVLLEKRAEDVGWKSVSWLRVVKSRVYAVTAFSAQHSVFIN